MKKLWAPWRMEYILSMKKKKGCILCQLRNKKEGEALVLKKTPASYIVMNRYPYNNGHLMIVPKRHIADFAKMKKTEAHDLIKTLDLGIKLLKKTIAPQGFNVGLNLGQAAGAGVDDHLHFHLVPRWQGDCNFMPILSETKVISEHLEETYKKLLLTLKKLEL